MPCSGHVNRIAFLCVALAIHCQESTAIAFPQQSGWPFTFLKADLTAEPRALDVDGDEDLEVFIPSSIVGSEDRAYLFGVDHLGQILAGWPQYLPCHVSRPTLLVDINDNAIAEVFQGSQCGDYAWRLDGTPVFGWPKDGGGSIPDAGVLSLMAAGDIDFDGIVDFVQAGQSSYSTGRHGMIWVWNRFGRMKDGWPLDTGVQEIVLTPAFGDFDRDGALEMFTGTTAGNLYLVDDDGTVMAGWPISAPNGGQFNEESFTIGDINGDGDLEALASTYYGTSAAAMLAYDSEATSVAGWPFSFTEHPGEMCPAGPTLGDVDADGGLEVVFGTAFGSVHRVFVINGEDGSVFPGWPVETEYDVGSQPTIGDVDGDGEIEIVVSTGSLSPMDGKIYAFNLDGSAVDGFPIWTTGWYLWKSSPVLVDLDRDGDIEIGVCTSWYPVGGDRGRVFFWDLPYPYNPDLIEWPFTRHDVWSTGNYDFPNRIRRLPGLGQWSKLVTLALLGVALWRNGHRGGRLGSIPFT